MNKTIKHLFLQNDFLPISYSNSWCDKIKTHTCNISKDWLEKFGDNLKTNSITFNYQN